jgi:TRAP-type C4-dicarboxylate transport system permease small subunit
MFARVRAAYEKFLEGLAIVLMLALAAEVTIGVVFRYLGEALTWYDEIASVLLAWVTYYGAALGALKRAHLGVPELVRMLPPALRLPLAIVAEACVFAFFIVLAWMGYAVLDVLATDNLVSLPGISVAYTQSVIPLSALLFIIAEALALPDVLAQARTRRHAAHAGLETSLT